MDKNYQRIEFSVGTNVGDAVRTLLNYKERGISACGEFNGHMLYSDTVTLDGAYIEVTGKTKAQLDRENERWKEEYKREEKKFKNTIPDLSKEWMRKGREILTEDKWEYWDTIVPIRLNDLYHGMELGACLDIIKILNNQGTLEEAKKMIESQGHSGMSFGLVCAMVKEFCVRGAEFCTYVR